MPTESAEPELHRTLKLLINERSFETHDPEVTGRQLLNLAGDRPPDDFIIYHLGEDNVLADIGLDETVHLKTHAPTRFLTFKSDRSFRFEIDGKREDWGAPTITEETLRKLADAGPDARVCLERRNEPDQILKKGERVDLSAPGTERFYTEKAMKITVVNEDNGSEFALEGFGETKLDELFREMYARLKVTRRSDDRLRCEEGGGDVFQYGSLTLKEYMEAGHCHCLVWLFAGGTGGAVCR